MHLVEEAFSSSVVLGGVNATFIGLILKHSNLVCFQGYHPISLCNLNYNIITKVILNIIKIGLSKGISKKKFGFLQCNDRRICPT